ncbi:MAG: hypothetical protein ABJ258_02595 [Marinomonas sp.]
MSVLRHAQCHGGYAALGQVSSQANAGCSVLTAQSRPVKLQIFAERVVQGFKGGQHQLPFISFRSCVFNRHHPVPFKVKWDGMRYSGRCLRCGKAIRRKSRGVWKLQRSD